MAKFQGGGYNSVDDKGRIIIPLRFRSLLGERFILTRGFDGCVFIFTLEMWNQISQKFDNGPLFDSEKIALQRFLFGTAQEVQPDSQGRIAIPQELRNWADIQPNSEVAIIGCNNWVEIWSKDRYDKSTEEQQNMSKALMETASRIIV